MSTSTCRHRRLGERTVERSGSFHRNRMYSVHALSQNELRRSWRDLLPKIGPHTPGRAIGSDRHLVVIPHEPCSRVTGRLTCYWPWSAAEARGWFARIVNGPYERALRPIEYVRSLYRLGGIAEGSGDAAKAVEYDRRFLGYWGDGEITATRWRSRVASCGRSCRTQALTVTRRDCWFREPKGMPIATRAMCVMPRYAKGLWTRTARVGTGSRLGYGRSTGSIGAGTRALAPRRRSLEPSWLSAL